MNWEELLLFLQNHVTTGTITTYGNLSTVFYGGPNAAPSIVAMLNGAIRHDPSNQLWTNRVVSSQGNLNVPGQGEMILMRKGRMTLH